MLLLSSPPGLTHHHLANLWPPHAALQEPDTSLDITLSRGIDPNVADPTKCHPHPGVPTIWPSKRRLLEYVAQVGMGVWTGQAGRARELLAVPAAVWCSLAVVRPVDAHLRELSC